MQVASCDARPRTRKESYPRPAGPVAGARTTRQLPMQKTSSFCTSTTPIPAEGCTSTAEIAKNLEFLHLDHADSRTGLRGHRRNRKKNLEFLRPRRSPQRVARAPQKSQKTMGFCTSTTPIPAEGRASTAEIAKNHGFLHLDHADPRRGSSGNFRNRKKPWVFAPPPRRSPQRVDFRVVSSALPRRPKKRF